MSIARDAPATLTERRVIVLFSADFLAAFANVKLDGTPRIEHHGGKAMIAVPAVVTAPAGAFPAEGERVDVSIQIITGTGFYSQGVRRRPTAGTHELGT